MTADNFTEAARAEAERVREENSPLEYGTIRATFLDAFLAGAEWSRDHLAAQEPTDSEVEAAILAYDDVAVGLGSDYAPGAAIRAALTAARRDEEDR